MTKDYYDIINRKSTLDTMGEGLIGAANQMKPQNANQRVTSNILRGLGTGVSMASQMDREDKLKEIEEQARQVSELDYAIKMSSGKNKQREESLKLFYNDYRKDLGMANEMLKNGEYENLDIIIPSLVNGYKKTTGQDIGEYVSSSNGLITLKGPDGKYHTSSFKDFMNPIIDVIPENDRGGYDAFMTTYQKKDFDNIRRTKDEQLKHLYMQNEHLAAQVKSLNATALKTEKEASMPFNNEFTKNELRKDLNLNNNIQNSNIKFIDEVAIPKIKTADKLIKAYTKLGSILAEEENSWNNRSGPSFVEKAYRFVNYSGTESSRRQHLIALEKEPLWHEFKEIFGGKASDQDLAAFLTTMPDLNNPYEANKEAIEGRIAKYEEEKFILENTIAKIEEDNYKKHHSHSSYRKELDELNKKRLEDHNKNNVNKKEYVDNKGRIKIYDIVKDAEIIKQGLINKTLKEK